MNIQEVKQLIYKGEKVDIECKKAENSVPKSVYESYSGFANTKGGYIFLGINEDKSKQKIEERFIIQGITNPIKQLEDFWNTINGSKVNVNILKDEDVFIVDEDGISIIVIHVPRATYNMRPVYVGENPYKGTYKRNHEGDYHMPEYEVNAMIRDRNPEGNDSIILEGFTMEDIDFLTLQQYRQRFQVHNPEHVWNSKEDKEFLENLGGYRKDRRTGMEGLTMAGLLMFGKGLAIRDGFEFTNPGTLKLPVDEIFKGGNSKSRNPRMQTMLRMVGFGDNAGSGFPAILHVWETQGWLKPILYEDINLNQITLTLKMIESAEKSAESANIMLKLTNRQKQILSVMEVGKAYSVEEIAILIGLKGPRTRQLVNQLVDIGKLEITAVTKGRRYIRL